MNVNEYVSLYVLLICYEHLEKEGDSNTDYRVSNKGGDFLVEKSVSGVETDYMRMNGLTGAITNPLGTASFSVGSDSRIKEGIERACYEECYRNMGRLELRRFRYKGCCKETNGEGRGDG